MTTDAGADNREAPTNYLDVDVVVQEEDNNNPEPSVVHTDGGTPVTFPGLDATERPMKRNRKPSDRFGDWCL